MCQCGNKQSIEIKDAAKSNISKSENDNSLDVKVSVIICTYKGEDSLKRAILSVLNQTYKNIELIVVDDNGIGTDHQIKTHDIVTKFDDVIYIPHKTNLNGAAARNTGFSFSSGDYICFLDDDDIMLPTRIEKSVLSLENTDKFDAVFVDVLWTNASLIPYKVVRVREKGNCYKNVLLDEEFLGTGSNLFLRRSAFKAINGFNTAFFRHQDLEFMLRYYSRFKTTFIPELLLIKSMNNTDNRPNYNRMVAVKKLYTDNFNSEISSLTPKERETFLKNTDHDLLYAKIKDRSQKLSHEDLRNMCIKDRIIRAIVILKLQKPMRVIKFLIQSPKAYFSLSRQERVNIKKSIKEI